MIWPKDSWCWGDLAKRLLGADSALAPRSLVARSPQHQEVFWPNHIPVIKLGTFTTGLWSGQKTPWVWGIWLKDSLVPGLSQHQGVFWPNQPNTQESFGQITHQTFPERPFPENKKNTKESFVQTTAEFSWHGRTLCWQSLVFYSHDRLESCMYHSSWKTPQGCVVSILVIVLVVMGRRPLTVHVSTRPWTVSTTASTIIVEGRPNKTR